jgi:hypothetical protein
MVQCMHDANGYVVAMRSNACIPQYWHDCFRVAGAESYRVTRETNTVYFCE